MEAAVVKQHVRRLVETGVNPEDIAVVTPYNAQVSLRPNSWLDNGVRGRYRPPLLMPDRLMSRIWLTALT